MRELAFNAVASVSALSLQRRFEPFSSAHNNVVQIVQPLAALEYLIAKKRKQGRIATTSLSRAARGLPTKLSFN